MKIETNVFDREEKPMDEYIKRDALIKAIKAQFEGRPISEMDKMWNAALSCAIGQVESEPSADVVERKHGKWGQKEVFETKGRVDELQSAFCSVCQRYHTTPYSYYIGGGGRTYRVIPRIRKPSDRRILSSRQAMQGTGEPHCQE